MEKAQRHGTSRRGNRTGPEDRSPLLIISDSETNADLYYATGFRVSGAVVYLEETGRKTLLVSDLEYGRARAEAEVDSVLSTGPFEERLRAAGRPARLTSILDLYLRDRGKRRARRLAVPASLPLVHAQRLRGLGYSLKLRDDPLFPQRTRKRAWEVRAIADAQARAEEAMALAVEMIRESAVRGGILYHRRDRGSP